MRHWLTLYLILSYAFLSTSAQDKSFHFQHITAKDGLSQGHVLCMIQDSRGYIWAGTFNGLNRFNGYDFDVFYADNKPGSIFLNVVYCLFEDSKGKIWCGTWGVDVFDPQKETFSHIPADQGPNSISAGEVTRILEDGNGYMWFATHGGGLDKYNPKTGEIKVFRKNDTTGNTLVSDNVNDILLEGDSLLWIATEEGGLSQMNLKDESLRTFSEASLNPAKLPDFGISCLYEDRQGRIWLAGNRGYLAQYDRETDKFQIYDCCARQLEAKRARIVQIRQDWNDNLLLATNGSGLISFDPGTKTDRIFLHRSDDMTSLLSNENSSLLIDRSGTLFVGSFGRGISKYSPYSEQFDFFSIPADQAPSSDINACTEAIEDSRGNLVVGTYFGFLVFNQKTWEYKHFLPGKDYESNKVLTLQLAPDSTLWICTLDGIYRYSSDYKKLKTYRPDPSLADRAVYSIEFDQRNNLWIGLFREGMIRVPEKVWRDLKRDTLDYTLYQIDYSDPESISGNQQWVVWADKDGIVWIGGVGGLCRYNPETDNFTRVFDKGTVKTLDKDPSGNLWLGTIGEGLFKLDPATGNQKRYTTADGLNHSFIYAVMCDSMSNIWISSEAGLSKFNPHTENFRNFDRSDGLPDDHFDDKAYQKLSGGRFYLGTNNGFIVFKPKTIRDDTTTAKIVLTGLQIDNEPVDFLFDEKANASLPVDNISQVTLSPDHRDLQFDFAALHYASPQNIQYKYMLKGYDKKWIYTNSTHRIARYTNLSPGSYTFLVSAANSDGYWSDEPLKIDVKVVPPFYKTRWFILSMLAVILLSLYLIFRWWMKRVFKQKIKLEKLVGQRTRELHKKNSLLEQNANNLKKANKQLEEGKRKILKQSVQLATRRDELAFSNATKDKLFSIIAHDLKNPFNVLLGYAELLHANFYTWDDKKKLLFIGMLRETSENAYQLLENLLTWSRSQSNMLKFNPKTLHAKDVFKSVLTEIKSMADKKSISIHFSADRMKDVKIRADKDMLRVILRNLLTNAIKFSQPESEIFVDIIPLEDGFARVSIRDQGVGISPAELKNLFVFENKSSTTGTEGEKGTGLGLILSHEFVKCNGGEIRAESQEGAGTTFYFTVPLDKT